LKFLTKLPQGSTQKEDRKGFCATKKKKKKITKAKKTFFDAKKGEKVKNQQSKNLNKRKKIIFQASVSSKK